MAKWLKEFYNAVMKLLNFGKKDTIYFIFQEHETKHEKPSFVTTLKSRDNGVLHTKW